MIDQDSLKNIEDLHRMNAEGIITDAEFEQSKQRILFGTKAPKTAGAPLWAAPAIPPLDSDKPLDWAIQPFKRYADFDGRSTRKEFWLFLLLTNVVAGALAVVAMMDVDRYGDIGAIGKLMFGLIILGAFGGVVPYLAVQVRRLHDQDRSGWFALLNLVPYAGFIVVLILMVVPGTEGVNRFGPDPKTP
jgi:uncharacterized membrane protein YhaH (DUF805 family)